MRSFLGGPGGRFFKKAPLAAEGISAFFLESVFLGILVFGRTKVSRKAYWWSAFMVFFGSHLSGLWIIIANSWMQTPAGYKMEGGRAVLTNFLQAALNHSTVERFLHTLAAGWITGSLAAASIAAWYILKNRDGNPARPLLRFSLIIFITASLLQLGLGHAHSVQVAKTQPEKMAAFEALWKSEKGAPFAVFGIPDSAEQKTHAFVGIPKFLSFLIHLDPEAEVLGLNEFPAGEQPPVFIPFVSYHIMIFLGMIFILASLTGIVLFVKKRIFDSKWYLRSLIFLLPLPYIANETGWIAAEVGRQPWAVFRVLRTADAASVNVPAGNILFSLILFALVYALIGTTGISIILRLIRKGPEDSESGDY